MGYINPIISYGIKKFVEDAKNAGVNGFIIPDLPPNEATEIIESCKKNNMAINFLLSPNSPENRIELVTEESTGFVYLVSVMGITGERINLPNNLQEFYKRVRLKTEKPIAIGFGISTPEQAKNIGNIADGVIIGSALIKAVSESTDMPLTAGKFVREIKSAMTTIIGEKQL